jgi:hypothetical protein
MKKLEIVSRIFFYICSLHGSIETELTEVTAYIEGHWCGVVGMLGNCGPGDLKTGKRGVRLFTMGVSWGVSWH